MKINTPKSNGRLITSSHYVVLLLSFSFPSHILELTLSCYSQPFGHCRFDFVLQKLCECMYKFEMKLTLC